MPGVKPPQETIEQFVDTWAPKTRLRHKFIDHLRHVLEEYGKAALAHEGLPDTDHKHGDPV